MNGHSFVPYLTQECCLSSTGSISSIWEMHYSSEPHPPRKNSLGMLKDASRRAIQRSLAAEHGKPTLSGLMTEGRLAPKPMGRCRERSVASLLAPESASLPTSHLCSPRPPCTRSTPLTLEGGVRSSPPRDDGVCPEPGSMSREAVWQMTPEAGAQQWGAAAGCYWSPHQETRVRREGAGAEPTEASPCWG